MGLIDGIGDEVLHFFIAISLILVVTIAWATTNIRQQWNMRVVYLLDRSGRIRSSHTLSNHLESATISEGTDPGEVMRNAPPSAVTEDVLSPTTAEEPPERGDSSVEEDNDDDDDEDEVDADINEIVETMDMPFIENISVFRRNREVSALLNPVEEIAASEEIVGDAPQMEQQQPQPSAPQQQQQQQQQQQEITIKLKFINDDLKIVNGRLSEMLGDFKRRHFEDELSSNKLVRLIFNGQVLQRDSDTLQSYGIFDNCVVHCLVYQQRENAQDSTLNANINNNNNNNNNQQREWDLGNLFIATVSFSLGTAWYFRYQYPQLFTVTATAGLITMTGVFTVLSISSYFPDPMPPLQEDIPPQLHRLQPIHR